MNSEARVIIIGAGGHGQVVADLLLSVRESGTSIVPIGFLDDNPALQGETYLGLPVLGEIRRLSRIGHEAVVIGVGNNRVRKSLYDRLLSEGEQFISATHVDSMIARNVTIDWGSIICAGAIIKTGTAIGENVIVNSGSGIGHHNIVQKHVHVGPGAKLGADVIIEEGALLGIGSVVTPGRKIGSWSVIGAGAVVIQDVPPDTTVVGVPAKPIASKLRRNPR